MNSISLSVCVCMRVFGCVWVGIQFHMKYKQWNWRTIIVAVSHVIACALSIHWEVKCTRRAMLFNIHTMRIRVCIFDYTDIYIWIHWNRKNNVNYATATMIFTQRKLSLQRDKNTSHQTIPIIFRFSQKLTAKCNCHHCEVGIHITSFRASWILKFQIAQGKSVMIWILLQDGNAKVGEEAVTL